MRTAEQIADAYLYRRRESEPLTSRMRTIREVYNGDIVVPLSHEDERPAVANLVLTGIDQMAGRIASVTPQVWYPPVRPGIQVSEDRARQRTQANKGWWEANDLGQKMRQRARYLVAYASAPVYIRPDLEKNCPVWEVRNPLQVFPSHDLDGGNVPVDCISVFSKPVKWLRQKYPDFADLVLQPDTEPTAQVTLLEYVDADMIAMVYAGVIPHWEPGQVTSHLDSQEHGGTARFMPGSPMPNRAGCPLVTYPRRTVLDKPQGQFDQMLGMYEAQARLTSLEIVAVERGIFPDTYLVSRPGELARFIHGPYDGRSGEVNIVAGGEVRELQSNPGFSTNPMIDRLERGQRLAGGVPPEFGGESTSNIRTGRRGDAVLSAVVDHPVAEAQDAFAAALERENHIAAKVAMGWWGSTQVTHYYRMKGKYGEVTYRPDEIFGESIRHTVSYPVAGADVNALTVGLGQRLGLGLVSRRTAAELDPLVDDPEYEMDRVTAEALDSAILQSIQALASGGGIPPEVVARTATLVRTNRAELADAFAQATEEYTKAQQESQPAPDQAIADMLGGEQTAGMPPGAPGGPPMGEPAPTVAEPGPGLQNLSGLLTALRKTNTRAAGREALGGGF